MLLGLTVGCSQDDGLEGDGGQGGGVEATSYVTLNFTMAHGQNTRATGGENGDGTEAGQETETTDENGISSAVAFLYQDDGGVNGDLSTPVTPVYFSNVTKTDDDTQTGVDAVYTTEPQSVSLPNGDYHVIVIANPGADWWTTVPLLTLGQVRDHIQTSAWTESSGRYSDFLMSSEDDASFTLASNPQNSPAEVTVSVERMAARIDYKADGSFTCGDKSGSVEITGAAIVNDFSAGSYLLNV